ncbi:MAG: glycosyltransferase family 39 protein [Bacteroidales bacterium]|nr:glycosyltransferase family 39 protein [Bacteroidales bacterium]
MGIAACFPGLFTDVTRDAAKYAFVSKEIFETGNWMQISIMGEPYYQKPQLLFWLSAAAFQVFGISNFSFKILIFIYSLLGCFAVFKLSERLTDRKTGFISAIMVIFSVIFVLYTMDIHTDTVLFTNVALSLWAIRCWLTNEKPFYAFLSGLALGLSFITKGPFGLLIPIGSAAGFLLWKRKISAKIAQQSILIVFLTILVGLLAVVPIFQKNGFNGVWYFLWDNNLKRLSGEFNKTSTDYFFYFHNLLYLFLPWTLFLFSGIVFIIRDYFRKKLNANGFFIFWGLFLFLFILSIAQSKLPNYIMSGLPLLAIVSARAWNEIFDKKQKTLVFIHIIILIVLILFTILIPLWFPVQPEHYIWIGIPALTIPAFIFFKTNEAKTTLFVRTLITMLAIALTLNLYVFPMLFSKQGAPKAAKIINEKSLASEEVYYLSPTDISIRDSIEMLNTTAVPGAENIQTELHFYRNYELMFYCEKSVNYIEQLEDIEDIINRRGIWIYTDPTGLEQIQNLTKKPLDLFSIDHLNLKRPAKYIRPSTRGKSLEKTYLVHLE